MVILEFKSLATTQALGDGRPTRGFKHPMFEVSGSKSHIFVLEPEASVWGYPESLGIRSGYSCMQVCR